MKDDDRQYYVYCYIDPRNFQEFYYGKGVGSRSHSHLLDQGASDKAAQIRQIRADGEEPLIRIIASGLTENEALLVESTLIWKLGQSLTNQVAGHYVKRFRPQNTLHKKLIGFDFSIRVHLFNVGESGPRSWDDCRKYGFLSAGYGEEYAWQAQQLHKSDIAVAYLSQCGYVGIGRVVAEAVPAREFRTAKGKSLAALKRFLDVPEVLHDIGDDEMCEWVIRIKWLKK